MNKIIPASKLQRSEKFVNSFTPIDRGQIKGTKTGEFFAKKGEAGEFTFQEGTEIISRFVDEKVLFQGESSRNFLFSHKSGIWNNFDSQLQRELGFDNLADLEEASIGGNKSLTSGKEFSPTRRFKSNPNEYFRATQERAKQLLMKEGFKGAHWTNEDELIPTQYQIWDKTILKINI